MNFEEEFNLATDIQKKRFNNFVSCFEGIELSESERRNLLWLAGWDSETEITFTNLFKKLKM